MTGACGDTNETSDVTKASPEITTTAGTTGTLPGAVTISDIAHLTGLTETATGDVTFTVYGPFAANSSPTCTGEPFDTLVVGLGSVGADHAIDVSSGDVPVTAAGKYYWVASYGGDAANNPVAGECGDDNETSTVDKASPAISTVAVATDPTVPTTSVQDSATLTGLTANATGSVTFTIYSNSSCTAVVTTLGPVAIGTVTGGAATAVSPAYTGITTAGDYFFIARYSGDANNNAVSGHCGDANEVVHLGALVIVKAVSPVAGNGVVVNFGDTLTYTLTVSATGTLSQPNVVVNDYIPGTTRPGRRRGRPPMWRGRRSASGRAPARCPGPTPTTC